MATTVHSRSKLADTLRTYLQLTKPRIVVLLIFTTATAMIIAADGLPAGDVFLLTMVGGAMAAAGSSAVNQYIDREMDALMARTASRPIPSGRIAPRDALAFGLALIVNSVIVLGIGVNWLAALLALGGAIYYVWVYTILLKRNTTVNIIIGGGAGAMPVLVGWAAVTGTLGIEAWILFGIIFYWTPPHSWALALLVNKDYARAGVPMMPVRHGERATHWQIIVYSVLLVIVTLLPAPLNMLGPVYTLLAALLGAELIRLSVKLFRAPSYELTRRTWKYSTLYLAFLFLAMIVDSILPF